MMRWAVISALVLLVAPAGWASRASEPEPALRQLEEQRLEKRLDRLDVFMRHYEWCLDEASYRQRLGGDWWETFEACMAPTSDEAGGFISRMRNPE